MTLKTPPRWVKQTFISPPTASPNPRFSFFYLFFFHWTVGGDRFAHDRFSFKNWIFMWLFCPQGRAEDPRRRGMWMQIAPHYQPANQSPPRKEYPYPCSRTLPAHWLLCQGWCDMIFEKEKRKWGEKKTRMFRTKPAAVVWVNTEPGFHGRGQDRVWAEKKLSVSQPRRSATGCLDLKDAVRNSAHGPGASLSSVCLSFFEMNK